MTGYLMEAAGETERLARKTESVLVRRHLAWARLRPGESFVDVGCGSGEVVLAATRITDGPVIGLDANPERLRHVRAACARAGADVVLHAARIDGPGSSRLPGGTVDHAWARFLVEYQPDPVAFVREMARLVRPGGRVTLIDLEGNGTRHFGMPDDLRGELDAILADLATTGFDPEAGRRLAGHARAAALVDLRHEIEPYHRIVGRPDEHTLDLWRRKLEILAAGYASRFPDRPDKRPVFAALLDFIARPDTMNWSLLHLVQGTRPEGYVSSSAGGSTEPAESVTSILARRP